MFFALMVGESAAPATTCATHIVRSSLPSMLTGGLSSCLGPRRCC